jgi:hypothetical protein
MLEDPSYNDIVRWNDTGDSFVVLENERLYVMALELSLVIFAHRH